MSKVYKFPLQGDSTARWVVSIFFALIGACLLLYGIFEEGVLYFGVPIFIVGILMIGVKRNIIMDTGTGTITSVRGFFFFTNTEIYYKRDFEEVCIQFTRVNGTSDSVKDKNYLYNLVLNGRSRIIVDGFGEREGAHYWQRHCN